MEASCPIRIETALRESVERAWRQLGALEVADFGEVGARYGEPHRAYHTLEHVFECQRWLAATCDLAERPCEVEIALVYHDVVYDQWRSDNEQRSAELFRGHAQARALPLEPTARICALIEGTASHRSRHGDSALLNDIDLAVLGASPARYEIYEQQVRSEYAALEERLFRAGRERVVRSFLETTAIYGTPFFGERLEAQARRNLGRALTHLQAADREPQRS